MSLRDFAYDAVAPLRGPPLVLVLLVTPLTALAQVAGMFGVPLLAILAGWVWSYTYLIIEATAEGLDSPVLSIERTNPWHEPRALVPPLVALIAGWIASGHAPAVGTALATAVAMTSLLLLPASLALLAAGSGLARAFWPPALFAVIGGLGLRYAALLLLGGGYLAALALLWKRLPQLPVLALCQLALYSFGAALGRSLYRRRHALDLDPQAAPEQQRDRAAAHASREADAVSGSIYVQLRVRRDTEAWLAAVAWLDLTPGDPTPCRWLRDQALAWGEPRFVNRLDNLLVTRLVAAGRLGEAIGTIEGSWARGDTPGPRPIAESRALLAAATRMGHAETAARLARDLVQDGTQA